MSKVVTTGTGPELRLRSVLHARGYRYRVGSRPISSLRCYPDLVFTRAKVAVFVDGCFWHGCLEHQSWPKWNAEWWRDKIARNSARDALVSSKLAEAGWRVVRLWEHQTPDEAASIVEAALHERLHQLTRTQISRSINVG